MPLGEANGSPISDNEAKLQVLTQISTGENQLILEGFYLDSCVRGFGLASPAMKVFSTILHKG
jgi:hypothetical protein